MALKAKVKPSQRMSQALHEAWVVLDIAGNVLAGHCSCMAGCGEVCSHVAGVLFKVEAAIRLQLGRMTCTSLPCAWNQAFSKKVLLSPMIEILFFKPKKTTSETIVKQHEEAKLA
uniref:SWIM-type domain-containing protein n=1 Tax=Amphimedon queenslandica TaxID=400682 RepID=A0A1X7TL36_AMPQE